VLGVNGSHLFNAWGDKPLVAGTAEGIAQALPASAWARLSAGEGTKGARRYDWADLELADLEAAEYDDGLSGLWTRGLLVRRSIADGELAFFSTWCPAGTGIDVLVKVEGHRWAIEDGFETAETELGLDHNETRSGAPLPTARLAPPCLAGDAGLRPAGGHPPARERAHTPKNPDPARPEAPSLIRWSVQEIRRIAVRLAQRRIQPAHVLAWSLWRRAHQAAAQRSYLKQRMQL
jgi:hypothetical protein